MSAIINPPPAPPEEETVFTFLNRREQELTHQIAALRGQIDAKENELAYVKKAKAATAVSIGIDRQNIPAFRQSAEMTSISSLPARPSNADEMMMPSSGPLTLRSTQQYEGMTIKQLAVQALLDHFPGGTTAPLLRDFFRNAYGRDVETGSLRPQLHRLKAEGILSQDSTNEKWRLSPDRAHVLLSDSPALKHDEESDVKRRKI
jgi:hypothetical protein